MLNADIGLFRDLDNHDTNTGRVTACQLDSNSCNLNSAASRFVIEFADNPQAWLDAFVSGYIKMITVGYDIGTELVDQANPGSSAQSVMVNFIDDIIGDSEDEKFIQINGYLIWIMVVLLVVNIICLSVYCWNNKYKSNKRKYKMVQYDSEVTDHE